MQFKIFKSHWLSQEVLGPTSYFSRNYFLSQMSKQAALFSLQSLDPEILGVGLKTDFKCFACYFVCRLLETRFFWALLILLPWKVNLPPAGMR